MAENLSPRDFLTAETICYVKFSFRHTVFAKRLHYSHQKYSFPKKGMKMFKKTFTESIEDIENMVEN